MKPGRLPKMMLDVAPGGRKERGRPRRRWIDDLDGDLRRMGIENWRNFARDREM